MASRIPEDLDRLQADIATKLRGCGAAHQAAGAQVLVELQALWADHDQGIPEVSVRLINSEVTLLIDKILGGSTPVVVRAGVDELVAAWKRLKPRLILP